MKTASKVLIILTMIFASISIVLSLFLCFTKSIVYIIPILACIAVAIVADIGLRKLRTAKKSSDLTVSAILVLVFVNLIAGILMLLIKDEDLAK